MGELLSRYLNDIAARTPRGKKRFEKQVQNVLKKQLWVSNINTHNCLPKFFIHLTLERPSFLASVTYRLFLLFIQISFFI